MPFERIIVVGEMTNLFVTQASREGYAREKIRNLGPVDPHQIIGFLEKLSAEQGQNLIVFGCGNMIGIESFIDEFEALAQAQDSQPSGSE